LSVAACQQGVDADDLPSVAEGEAEKVCTSDVHDQGRALDFHTHNFRFVKRSDFAGPEGRFLTTGFEGQDIEVVLCRVHKDKAMYRCSLAGH
jgi:hypothetical protein